MVGKARRAARRKAGRAMTRAAYNYEHSAVQLGAALERRPYKPRAVDDKVRARDRADKQYATARRKYHAAGGTRNRKTGAKQARRAARKPTARKTRTRAAPWF